MFIFKSMFRHFVPCAAAVVVLAISIQTGNAQVLGVGGTANGQGGFGDPQGSEQPPGDLGERRPIVAPDLIHDPVPPQEEGQNASGSRWFDRWEGTVIQSFGFDVTGSSGADADGFAEWISFQLVTNGNTGTSVSQDGREMVAIRLGPDNGLQQVVNKQQLVDTYNKSIERSNGYSQQINDYRQLMDTLAWRHNNSTDLEGRAEYLRQYQGAEQMQSALVELWKAEVQMQMKLRPGYTPEFR